MFLPFLTFVGSPAGGGVTFPGGYGYRAPMPVSGAALGGTTIETNVPLRFDETLPELKSVANGGLVESDDGWDILFHTQAGRRLSHELEEYDPVTGRAAGYVLLPSLNPAANLPLWWYIGKPGIAASETDRAGVWAPWCYAVWRMPDGLDVTGRGYDLTMSGTITGSPVYGMPTANWNGSGDYGNYTNPVYFDGATAWTVMLWINPTTDGAILRYGGSVPGSSSHTIWRSSGAFEGGYKLGDLNPVLHGPAGSASGGGDIHFAYMVGAGLNPRMFRDGEELECTMNGRTGAGSIDIENGDTLRLGANPGSNPGAVQGERTRTIHASRALSPEFIRFCFRSDRDPRSCYGLGDNEEPTGDRSPSLLPIYTTCAAGNSVLIPMAGSASDPDGTALTPSVADPPSQGTATATDDGWTYQANTSATGYDRFLARVTAALKQASASVTVTIGGGGSPESAQFPHGPWIKSPVAPSSGPNRIPVSTAGDLRRAIENAQSGQHIIITGSMNLGGDLVIDRPVSGVDNFYIRGPSETEGAFPTITGGDFEFRGARKCTVRDLHLSGSRLKWYQAKQVQVECLRVTNIVGDTDAAARFAGKGDTYKGMWSQVEEGSGSGCDNVLIGFIHYEQCRATPFDISQTEKPTRFVMTHIFADRRGGASKLYQPGRNPYDGTFDTQNFLQYVLDRGTDNQHDWCELKHNGTWIRHCTIHMSNTDGGAPQQTKIRHGRIGAASASVLTARANIMEGLLYIQDGKGNAPSITIRGLHHKIINCWVLKPDGSAGNGTIECFTGVRDPYIFPRPKTPTFSGEPPDQKCRFVASSKIGIAGNRNFRITNPFPNGGTNERCPGAGDWSASGYDPDQCHIPASGSTQNVGAGALPAGFKRTVTTPWPDDNRFVRADNSRRPNQLQPTDVGPSAYRTKFNPT